MTHYTLIVDDHPLYREGLSDTLGMILTDTVVLKASSAEEGLLMTDHLQDVRLICIDLGLPKIQGVDAVSIFKTKFPRAVLVVVSGSEQPELQRLALERGATCFIPKSAMPNDIAAQVHRAMTGEWLAPSTEFNVSRSADAGQIKPILTVRQTEVLSLVASGMSNKQIARHMNLAEVTVKLHITGIFRAFGANCRSQALLVARRSGLLPEA